MAVEQPRYQTLESQGNFEIRAYPAMIAAEVDVTGDRSTAANRGFRSLADYIFGANAPKAKIAMTAPVTQSPRGGEKIAMTAPVTQAPAGADGSWTVRFIMPAQYRMEDLPAPTNPNVRLVPVAPYRVAALRFSGFAGEKTLAAKTADLQQFMSRKGLNASGPATYAFYDPPWTLPFLRRNEVMIPIAG